MTSTGIVSAVFAASGPENDKLARKVIVDLISGDRTSIFLLNGTDPPVGSTISWGLHYAWNAKRHWCVHKLTLEIHPDEQLSNT